MASKLQREIHNQLDTTSPSKLSNCIDEKPSKDLILRKLDLLPVLPDVLVHCKPHALHIVNLDVSFSIADFHILNLLCNDLTHLQVIHAKSCGLCDTHNLVSWPKKLHALDLSRNELKECPQGVSELLYLAKLNLSGNSIEFMPPGILAIPSLVKCLLLNNPIRNIPKDICRGGVGRMRSFLMVEPHSLPPRETIYRSDSRRTLTASPVATRAAASNCNDLRRHVLRNQGSFESGYESNHRRTSSSTNSSDIEWSESSDIEADLDAKVAWPAFHSNEIPEGYIEMEGRSQLCQVYLPNDCRERVEIHEVKDMSLHPRLEDNELLITPVVRITPHGLKFGSKPAIIILSHCTQNNQSQMMDLVPMCSNTREYQTPEWTNLETPPTCEIFEDCIMFTTFHFSLFAIAASYPYPSSSLEVWPGVGGDMLIPELPGFHLHVSDHSVKPINAQVSIKGTAYYCDKSYRASDQLALASACIGVEPHGTEFNSPVQISVPIPDYTAIKLQFPDAKLELWCSERILSDHADTPRIWKCVDDADILIERSEDIDHELESEIAIFTTDHFSWYEFLWTVYASSLQRVGLGAASLYAQLTSRARYVAVRFQAFMSPPYGTGNSFGLVVTVYKFGDPLSTPSNYPLLVADSGIKRLHLRTGNLHVRIEGCFLASKDIGEVLERNGRILDFTGEDFCERFEFALSLKVGVSLPLPEGQVLGKLRFIQWEDSNPIHKSYNLIMPSSNHNADANHHADAQSTSPPPTIGGFKTLADFTPPMSPKHEPDHSWRDHTPSSMHSQQEMASDYERQHMASRKRIRRDSGSFPSDHTPKRRLLVRESEITDKALLGVATGCGTKYMELGISLGLDYQSIANRISRLEGKAAEHLKAFEVLQEWKSRGASYGALARALEEIGLNNVASKHCYVGD